MNLFRQAKRIQRRQGETGQPLTLDILADAYRQRLKPHVGVDNPFRTPSKTPVQSTNGEGLTSDTQ
jgi:hypothetical protein